MPLGIQVLPQEESFGSQLGKALGGAGAGFGEGLSGALKKHLEINQRRHAFEGLLPEDQYSPEQRKNALDFLVYSGIEPQHVGKEGVAALESFSPELFGARRKEGLSPIVGSYKNKVSPEHLQQLQQIHDTIKDPNQQAKAITDTGKRFTLEKEEADLKQKYVKTGDSYAELVMHNILREGGGGTTNPSGTQKTRSQIKGLGASMFQALRNTEFGGSVKGEAMRKAIEELSITDKMSNREIMARLKGLADAGVIQWSPLMEEAYDLSMTGPLGFGGKRVGTEKEFKSKIEKSKKGRTIPMKDENGEIYDIPLDEYQENPEKFNILTPL